MVIYNILSCFCVILYPVLLLIRVILKKEDLLRVKERFAITKLNRPAGSLIWIHAASVGESVAAFTVINMINDICKKYSSSCNFLITTSTLSAAFLVKNRLSNNIIHQFAPIDNMFFIKKFLRLWKPNLVILIESELWPCLIYYTSQVSKLLLVSACISNKSFKMWKLFGGRLFSSLLNNCMSAIAVQAMFDFDKFRALGVRNIKNLGNIKFVNNILKCDTNIVNTFITYIHSRKIFVAASTHIEDESVILQLICDLKSDNNTSYYFILIPRHPLRVPSILKKCNELCITARCKSNISEPDMNIDLYIVDSFGELGTFYTIADVVFIGGSFKQGGHNLLEAAYFNTVIILGPDMSAYQDIVDEMIAAQAVLQINDLYQLKNTIVTLLDNNDMHKYSTNALNYVNNKINIIRDNYSNLFRRYVEMII